MIAYLKRAVNRAGERGLSDTLRYSFHVARNAIASRYIDIRYGGMISKDRLHINDHRPGYNSLMHSEWKVLREIFQRIPIRPDDILVDVGCGDGRVLNFWLSRGYRNRMVGIEISEEVAVAATRRYEKYLNVRIMCADASIADTGGTVFYFYNAFTGEPLRRFAELLSDKPATIVLYNYIDLTPFDGWNIEYLKSTRDEVQYRVAIISTRAARPRALS